MPLESCYPHHGSKRSPKGLLVGAAFVFANFFAMDLTGGPLLVRLTWLSPIETLRETAAALPQSVRWLLIFGAAELCAYGVHRLMHAVPASWRFHAVHHSPQEIDWLDAWRQHPIDFVVHGVCVGLPAALLGGGFAEIAGIILVRKAYTTFLHANISCRLTWLERVLVMPHFHRQHHRHDFRGNYAGTFVMLDRLFGTLAGPPEN